MKKLPSIRGLAPIFLSFCLFFILATPLFAQAFNIIPCGKGTLDASSTGTNKPCTFKDLVTLGNNVINFLIYGFAAPFAVLLFMWAGFLFIFKSASAGDISKAKGIFWNVVVGFVIALAAFLIIKLILDGIGIKEIPKELQV